MSNQIKVTLLRDHTHAGTQYRSGDTVQVAQHDREFMAALGIIAPAKTEPVQGSINKTKGDK